MRLVWEVLLMQQLQHILRTLANKDLYKCSQYSLILY